MKRCDGIDNTMFTVLIFNGMVKNIIHGIVVGMDIDRRVFHDRWLRDHACPLTAALHGTCIES